MITRRASRAVLCARCPRHAHASLVGACSLSALCRIDVLVAVLYVQVEGEDPIGEEKLQEGDSVQTVVKRAVEGGDINFISWKDVAGWKLRRCENALRAEGTRSVPLERLLPFETESLLVLTRRPVHQGPTRHRTMQRRHNPQHDTSQRAPLTISVSVFLSVYVIQRGRSARSLSALLDRCGRGCNTVLTSPSSTLVYPARHTHDLEARRRPELAHAAKRARTEGEGGIRQATCCYAMQPPTCTPPSIAQPSCLLLSLCSDVSLQLSHELSKHLKATLGTADLQASINAARFPDDKALHDPSLILQLPSQVALSALRPKPDFAATLGKLKPPRILLRPHHVELLRNLRNSLVDREFANNAIRVYGQPQPQRLRMPQLSLHILCPPDYCNCTLPIIQCAYLALCSLCLCIWIGGIMGGGKSTTMFVAEYFFRLAGGLVISISARDFTSGSKPLSALTQKWLAGVAFDVRQAAQLRSIPYTALPSSSLLDLIAVAALHEELCIFIFEQFISQLERQRR